MKKLSSLLLGLALSMGAQAGVVSYSFVSEETPTDINLTGPLGLFDSTLGTLTGVSLELYGEIAMTLRMANTAKTPMRRAQVMTDVDMFFGSTLPALDALLQQDGSPWMSWSVNTGMFQLAAGASATFEPVTDGGMAVIDASDLLSSFTVAGGGDFGLSCRSLTSTMLRMSGGNGQFSQSTTGACGASITYTYSEPLPSMSDGFGGGLGGYDGPVGDGVAVDGGLSGSGSAPMPVPEPPSLALLGLALGWMAIRGRRGGKARAEHAA